MILISMEANLAGYWFKMAVLVCIGHFASLNQVATN